MTFTTRQTSIRTIKAGDPKFNIVDGPVLAPRAGFEINNKCPSEYRTVIVECLNRGWLLPVANIKDSELFWEAFQE